MVLLSAIPVYKLWHNKTPEKIKAFWISVGLALMIAIPFLVRNVIISGWLLYPVTFLDLFGFKWEIPKGLAAYDALEIKTFGRGYNDIASYGDATFGQWVPHWFAGITGISKVMLILYIISILVFALYVAYFLVAYVRDRSGKAVPSGRSKVFDLSHRSLLSSVYFIVIGGTLIGCLMFWFFSAPLIRYGVVYVWLVPAVILGRLVNIGFRMLGDNAKEIVIKAAVILFGLWMVYKMAILAVEDAGRFNPAYLVRQQDYGQYQTLEFMLGQEKIYYPAEGDQIGYYPFPAATHDITEETELIGTTVREGFLHKYK
jgi:hypothetical protein